MAEAVSYNNASVVPQSCKTRLESGADGNNATWSPVTSRQRQTKPKGLKTSKVNGRYINPTPWNHSASFISGPTVSGWVVPFGLSSGPVHSYNLGFLNGSIPNFTVSNTGMVDLIEECNLKCLQKLKNQKVNLGQALAEARQTAELIGTNARRAANLLRSAASRNPKKWFSGVSKSMSRNYKNIPGYYLENVYGLTPLMSDIDGACQQLAETLNRAKQLWIEVYGVARRTDTEHRVLFSGQYGSYTSDLTHRRIAKVGVRASVPSWAIADYGSLGLLNPLSVAWETMPFSHVIDWFVPVGTWMETFDVGNYLTFESGYTTTFTSSSGDVRAREPTTRPRVWELRNDQIGRCGGFAMRRTLLSSFPRASYPKLRNPLSLDHMAQSLAMLTQVVRGQIGQARRGN